MLPEPAHLPTYREAYHRALLETFMRYVEDGGPLSIRTTVVGERTDVTLSFDTSRFGHYLDRIGARA